MKTYSHSGSLGDIIYSLPVIQKLGAGDLYIKLRSTYLVSKKYGYDVGIIPPYHQQSISDNTYKMLEPLLDAQPYINKCLSTDDFNYQPDIDLDEFRKIFMRSFKGNYVRSYFKTFNIPHTDADLIQPWLTAGKKPIAPYVICRTARYRGSDHLWKELAKQEHVVKNSIFVGLPDEHQEFSQTYFNLPHYEPNDFLELAEVINACDTFFSNQTFAYSLAQGLGKKTYLEWQRSVPWNHHLKLEENECFFQREGCVYL